jgi:UbiD family decarboxylase
VTAFRDLQSYIAELKRRGDLKIIAAQVSPDLEIAEIHRRVISEGGPALLFTNVLGSSFPVVTNLFGTKSRVDLAFGDTGKDFIKAVSKFPETLLPPSLTKLWDQRAPITKALKIGLKRQAFERSSISFSKTSPPKLDTLPVLKTWAEDGGPFFTLPLVYTEDPVTKIPNLGMYRLQRHSSESTGIHMQIGKGGGFHLSRAKELGQKLPMNVFLGGPPAAIMGAIAPLPENVPELLLSSLMLGEKIKLTDLPGSTIPALADAEFVLSGDVDADDKMPEGPFGDHYGYYSLKHDYPVFRVKSLFHRKGAIYPATVVGKPRQEDFFIGDYLQELLSPLFPVVMPTVKDLWSYGETGYHSLAAAVVKDRYKREALVSGFRILGEGQLSLTKFLLLTDKPQDLKDFKSVLTYILERADFRTDLYIFSNISMDTLDYAGPKVNEGSKGILLGVGPAIRELKKDLSGPLPSGIDSAEIFSPGCLVVSGSNYSTDRKLAERVANHEAFKDFSLIILSDDALKAVSNTSYFLWSVFTRFEPASDITPRSLSINRFHPTLDAPIVIDTRMKPWYPGELECDPETKNLVSSRWAEYGF